MNKREFTPEEIAKSLRACWDPSTKGCGSCPVAYEHCSGLEVVAADLIEAQAKRIGELEARLAKLQEENRWIPVTKRLPGMDDGPIIVMEDYTAVLVLVMIEGTIAATTLYCDVDNNDFFDIQGDELIPYRVTHWKPMPKGPEVGHE